MMKIEKRFLFLYGGGKEMTRSIDRIKRRKNSNGLRKDLSEQKKSNKCQRKKNRRIKGQNNLPNSPIHHPSESREEIRSI